MTTQLEKDALDRLGQTLITSVRTKAISDWQKILDGQMKGETADRLRPKISSLDSAHRDLLKKLVSEIVDTTLHQLLWTLDQDESIELLVRMPGGVVPSVREVSDGLAGQLYEWIPRFGS
jgi:hypothetical protein